MANTIIKPVIFAKEVIRNRDLKTTFYKFANTKFTGELKKAGDTVTVQLLPTLSFTTAAAAGAPITATNFVITSENLVIDTIKNLAVQLKDIEKVQSNLALETKVAERVAEAEARMIDEAIRDTILNATGTGLIDDGTGWALTIDKTNIFDVIEDAKVILAEKNVTDNLVLFVSPKWASTLRRSGLLDNTDLGLTQRIKGYVGMISGIQIVETNSLTGLSKGILMEKGAVNFVIQLNKYDVRQATDGFYENLLAEDIYGSKVFSENAKAICIIHWTI